MKRIFIPLIIIFFLLSCNTFSQDKNQTAENMAVRLQQKVLLSNDQTAKVKDILINYIQSGSQASLQTAQKNVESLLDKRQKAKYDIIKNDWWSVVRTEASKIRN
jgi:hypothetical protein